MKTFIYHDGALGDLILSLPCIKAIRGMSEYIHLSCSSKIAELFKDAGLVDELSSAGSTIYTSLYTDEPDENITKILRNFERAYIFSVKKDSFVEKGLSRIISDTVVIITIPPEGQRQHVADFRIRQIIDNHELRLLFPMRFPEGFPVYESDVIARISAKYPHRLIVGIHPGSGGRKKCWPLENYFELIERLKKRFNIVVLIFTGPAEGQNMINSIKGFIGKNEGIFHISDKSLKELAAIFTRCHLYIGNDSGISHFASALNVKSIVLFGPTDPVIWRPAGEHVSVIWRENISDIDVKEVFDKISDNLYALSR